MRALTWTAMSPPVMSRTATSTVNLRRISLRRDRVCVRATASSSATVSGGGVVEAVELAEIGERSKKWKWKGEYSVNYFVKDSPEEVTPASQTVLLVHGFGASIPHWRRNINALSKNHTVYAIDLLGFGASDKPPGFSYTMESWAELILNFLEEVVQKPTILIGNSVGSLACVIAASESRGDLVKGLVLLNCAGGMNNKAVFDDWRIKLLMPLLLLIDFLLKQRGIASALFNRVKDRENLKNILTNVYGNKDNVDDTLVEIIAGPANTEGALDAFVSILTGPPGPNTDFELKEAREEKMSGMGDGYVGTAQDAVRIRRLQKQREAERKKIQELKSKSASGNDQSGLLQFGTSSCEILDTAFKKETVGLVTREEYVEKRVNIRNKFEEEEKEKLQKLQQEEEELQLEKRNKKRKIKGSSRLSFAEDFENGSDEDDGENKSSGTGNLRCGKLGKDPSVETNFLPDSEREAEEQAERERLKKQWLREQEQIKNEPLEITYSYWDGTGHRRVIQVRKGDPIGNFLRAVQQQLAPDFREIRTASVENLLYVKEDLIIPHQHSFYELIINKARGKSGPLFHFDVHEDVRTIADATIEKDESHAGKVVERHWYEKNKHIFPASRWEIYDPTKKWERYTVHGD